MSDHPYQDGAGELLKWLEDRLADFNNNHGDMLRPHDRRDVQDAYVSLRSNFDGLARHFFEPARERNATLPESGYHFTWGLMNACFLVGARTVLSDSAANWKNKQNTNEGRKQKQKADAAAIKLLDAAIVAEIAEARKQGLPITKGQKCAERLTYGYNGSKGVLARLPSILTERFLRHPIDPKNPPPKEDLWPKWRTVQERIRKNRWAD